MDLSNSMWTVITHAIGHEPDDELPHLAGFLVAVTICTEDGDYVTIPGDQVVTMTTS